MNTDDMLIKVKSILMITGDELDATIMPVMLGVIGYMRGAGITEADICSDNGVVAVAIGTNDLWNLSSGDAGFSSGFLNIVKQLQLTMG